MNRKIKNIFNLTKILFKNSFQNPYIIDSKTNKINKKSIYVWLVLIVMIGVSYLSFEVVNELVKMGQPTLFLNIFFLIYMIIMIFQIVLISTNVYFFSKDLEVLLPLPIKAEELLISKFNTILINLYFSEFIFVFFPLIIYGICTYAGIIYYLYLIFILLIFPILPTLIISIITMLFMKLSEFIKNKDIFQIIITLIFVLVMSFLEFKMVSIIIEKIDYNSEVQTQDIVQAFDNFNKKLQRMYQYFLEINPTINIIEKYNKLNSVFELFKIIFMDLIFYILFILIGRKYYLKNILKNNNGYYLNKVKNNNLEKKCKKSDIKMTYLKKEFKLLLRSPIFFMQCIFQTFIFIISLIIISIFVGPNLRAFLMSDIFSNEHEFSINLGFICLILGIIQFILTISNVSITSVSREGTNANYMKFLPIDFYKQFIYKSIPQTIINFILIFIILILVKIIFPEFNLIYLFLIFIIGNLFNIINSELMVVVDFYKPNLNWKAEYEAVKSNNKIFQYALTIGVILILVYFNKIFADYNIIKSCLLIIIILLIFILIINKIIKKNINKLFKKINN